MNDMTQQPQTTGSIIDTLYELRNEKNAFNAKVKKINESMDELKSTLMARYAADETTLSRGKAASASLTEMDTFSIEDYDALQAYVFDNEALYLFQRRLSSAAIKELIENGEEIPGVKKFVKKDISLRKI